MGAVQRKIEGEVVRVLFAHDCKVLERGHDGAGHQTVAFIKHGQRVVFHYANTITMNGHSLKNVIARLRRIIREIPEPPPMPVVTLPPAIEPMKAMEALPAAPPPTPPDSKRLTRERRREIAKLYLSLGSLELVCARTGVEKAKMMPLLLSQRGQAAEALRRELSKLKMEAARRAREDVKPRLTVEERNTQITDLYFSKGMTAKLVGQRFGLAPSTVCRIARG